ncbi:ABC transporter permease [Pauljensenia sp. UMB6358]|uniref:ABC transporter permease n=1 Tax=Pauljensenia sp. UMB6358 TaxID=3046335 RepID=UPI0025516C62|nr:ABC transporter permease [Pauljensenia sp. UMB6358]MDK7122973.1 ABC transporter permease [Pauljensenia sp. UMB6358]
MSEIVSQGSIDSLQEQARVQSERDSKRALRLRSLMQNAGVLIPFVLILGLCVAFVPNFLSASNVTNVLIASAILGIIGLGQTVVIGVRGIDLSVGSAQALVACSTAIAMAHGGALAGVVCGIGVGLITGLINGLLVTQLRVPDFIATLSTMSVYRGAVLLITGGAPVVISSIGFKGFATTSVIGLPLPFIVAMAIGFAWWLVVARTRFGRHLIAVGDAPAAATDSGISVSRMVVSAYVLCGLMAGVAGVLLASQLGIVNGTVSTGLELKAIAIVVLGGTSMMGGRPRIVGTLIGALLLSMIYAALNLLNVSSFYQYIALGALLVFALSLDSLQRAVVKKAFLGGKASR